jgi:hypothetical protein
MQRTSDRRARKTVRLGIERRIVRFACGLREVNNSAIWKIRPLRKGKILHSFGEEECDVFQSNQI